MNEASKLIDSLWNGVDNLRALYERIKDDAGGRSPAVAGVIGRELLVRARNLSTPEFSIAAYLASEGEAGNDSLIDFVDCVAILPFGRYSKIAQDYDALADDPVRHEFDEFGFSSLFENRFESVFGEECEGLLGHLVFGESAVESEMHADLDPKSLFPRLFERYGNVLAKKSATDAFSKKATLDDFFG